MTFSKLRFSKFKKFVRSVFEELQLTQISLNFKTYSCNLKIRGLRAKMYVVFVFFNFEKNYDLQSKKESILFVKRKYKF